MTAGVGLLIIAIVGAVIVGLFFLQDSMGSLRVRRSR
jgi:hypothetical protein